MRTMSEKTFTELMAGLLLDGVFTQAEIARAVGVGRPHFNEMLRGRRTPSVNFVNRICVYMGRTMPDERRKEWHRAAARACGWQV